MKRKAIALLLSFTMLSLSTTAYAADTVQNAPTIKSSGKLVIGNTDITIDSKDLTDLASVFNNNATILTNVKDIAEQNETNIATSSDEYSSSKTYKEGGLCIKDGSLYQCTSEITTPEAWNSSHWKRVSISDSINSLYGDMESLKKSVSDGKSAIASAITEKGVSTESDATFTTMANNIGSLKTISTVTSQTLDCTSGGFRSTSYFSGKSGYKLWENMFVVPVGVWDRDNLGYDCDYLKVVSIGYNTSTGVITTYVGTGHHYYRRVVVYYLD